MDDDGVSLPVRALGAVLLLAAITLMPQHAPARRQPGWSLLVPGGLVALTMWIALTAALAGALSLAAGIGTVYGPLTGVMALLLWAQLTSVAIFLGFAVSAQLEESRLRHPGAGTTATAAPPPRPPSPPQRSSLPGGDHVRGGACARGRSGLRRSRSGGAALCGSKRASCWVGRAAARRRPVPRADAARAPGVDTAAGARRRRGDRAERASQRLRTAGPCPAGGHGAGRQRVRGLRLGVDHPEVRHPSSSVVSRGWPATSRPPASDWLSSSLSPPPRSGPGDATAAWGPPGQRRPGRTTGWGGRHLRRPRRRTRGSTSPASERSSALLRPCRWRCRRSGCW